MRAVLRCPLSPLYGTERKSAEKRRNRHWRRKRKHLYTSKFIDKKYKNLCQNLNNAISVSQWCGIKNVKMPITVKMVSAFKKIVTNIFKLRNNC